IQSSKSAVASFPAEEQEAMSPAPTSTAAWEIVWLAPREVTATGAAHNTHTMSPRREGAFIPLQWRPSSRQIGTCCADVTSEKVTLRDRKSTRLNSSHEW